MTRVILVMCSLLLRPTDYSQGVEFFEKHQYDAAISKLLRAVRTQPADSQAWKALGVSYAAKSDYVRAVDPLQRACKLDPKLEDACYFLGRALYALDRFELSAAVLRQQLPLDKHPWRIHLGIAQALEALGLPAEAEEEFRLAVANCSPLEDKAVVAYAHFLFRAGRLDDAVAALEPLLKTLPQSISGHLEMGRALYQLDRVTEAIPHLQTACSPSAESAPACRLLEKAQRLQGSRISK